jgi:type VI protein secretion system component Hcp
MTQRYTSRRGGRKGDVVRRRRRDLAASWSERYCLEVLEHRTLLASIPTMTLALAPTGSAGQTATILLDSFQFGASNSGTVSSGSGSGAGKVSFNELVVTAPQSGLSPQIFEALAAGTVFSSGVLTQYDSAGKALFQFDMSDVMISSDSISNSSSTNQTETVSLVFDALTEMTSAQTGSWSVLTNSPVASPPSPGLALAPLPAHASPSLTLDLTSGSGTNATTVSVALDAYQFGFENSGSGGSSGNGSGAGKVTFNDLQVSAPLSGLSPQIFQSMAAGKVFDTAVLTQRDTAGNPVAVWAMARVLIVSDGLTGSPGDLPAEPVQVGFEELTETTKGQTESWSLVTNSSTGPLPPAGLQLDALQSPARPPLLLALNAGSGASATTVDIALDSFQFSASNSASVGGAGGSGAGKVAFNDLVVTATKGSVSPQLFESVASGTLFSTAVLTQRDAAGNPVALWVMANVSIASDGQSGNSRALPSEQIQLSFTELTESTLTQTGSWSASTNTSNGPPVPSGTSFGALPGPSNPPLTLDLTTGSGASSQTISLALDSNEFGFQNSGTSGSTGAGAGVGKVSFNNLEVTAPLGGAAPQIFEAMARGTLFGSALLTQRDAAGNPVVYWVLANVEIASDGDTGSSSSPPTEQIQMTFTALSETTSAQTESWDVAMNKNTGPPPPAGVQLDALQSPANPPLTLDLASGSGAGATSINLALDSYGFGFQSLGSNGSTGAGGSAGKVSFNNLQVTLPIDSMSPQLFEAVAQGTLFQTGLLTQRNSAGNPVANWVMANVAIVFDGYSGSSGRLPHEQIQMTFAAVTVATSSQMDSWNVGTNSSSGPPVPAGTVFDALPGPVSPPVTLELDSGGVGSSPAIALDPQSYQLGFEHAGSSSAGAGAGKTTFNSCQVTEPIGALSPQRFGALTQGTVFGTAVVIQRDAAGTPVVLWVMADVSINIVGHTGASGSDPTETLQLNFDKLTYVTATQTAGFNLQTGSSAGPAAPTGITFGPLPRTVPTVTITDPGGVYSGAPFGVTNAAVTIGSITLATPGNAALSVTYFAGSPASGPGSALAPTQAGTFTVVAHYTSNNPGFADGDDAAVFTIAPAPLVVTPNSQTKVYGTAGPDLTGTVTGVVNGDGITATFQSAGTPANATVGNGPYAITATLNDPNGKLGNYSVTLVPVTLTVTLSPPGTAPVYVLDATATGALNLAGSSKVVLAGPIVVDSGSASAVVVSRGAKIQASGVLVAGGVAQRGKARTIKTGQPTLIGDPLAGLAIPTGAGTAISEVLGGKSSATIHPGVYSQINVSGSARLKMTPGVYIIEGGGFTVSGNAKVTGSGVTIFNTGNGGGRFGSVSASGHATVNLTAPTSGAHAGILIFQDPSDASALSLSGNARLTLSGTIYAAHAALAVSGQAVITRSAAPVSIVVDKLALSGGARVTS